MTQHIELDTELIDEVCLENESPISAFKQSAKEMRRARYLVTIHVGTNVYFAPARSLDAVAHSIITVK